MPQFLPPKRDWIEEELKDGDRICEAAGVERTEGGRLPVAKIINKLRSASPPTTVDTKSVVSSEQAEPLTQSAGASPTTAMPNDDRRVHLACEIANRIGMMIPYEGTKMQKVDHAGWKKLQAVATELVKLLLAEHPSASSATPREELMLKALRAAETYMKGQRAKSNAPFDPEALKTVRAAIAAASS